MYTAFQLAGKYASYYLTADNGHGHGVHSPFVYDFIRKVLMDKAAYPAYQNIEARRKQLLQDSTVIDVQDFGAGSTVIKSNQRVVKKIAASSLKPKKYAQLLYRMVQYYKPATVLELGTSLGITSSYLAAGNPNATIHTCEGAPSIAAIAQQQFDALGLKNICLHTGDFNHVLSPLLNQIHPVDFIFIDGNHRKIPTLDYFEKILPVSKPSSILVFDDIHWSAEMEEAWQAIQQHPAVTCTIDLFFIGIVLVDPSFKVPQHFTIRY